MSFLFNRKSFFLIDLMSETTEIKNVDMVNDDSEVCVSRQVGRQIDKQIDNEHTISITCQCLFTM